MICSKLNRSSCNVARCHKGLAIPNLIYILSLCLVFNSSLFRTLGLRRTPWAPRPGASFFGRLDVLSDLMHMEQL